MSQSRVVSAVEALASVAIGWLVALATRMVVFPAVGVRATLDQQLTLSAAFTSVSLVRSFVLRRVFEGITGRNPPGGGHVSAGCGRGPAGAAGFLRGHNSNRGSDRLN